MKIPQGSRRQGGQQNKKRSSAKRGIKESYPLLSQEGRAIGVPPLTIAIKGTIKNEGDNGPQRGKCVRKALMPLDRKY